MDDVAFVRGKGWEGGVSERRGGPMLVKERKKERKRERERERERERWKE